MSAELKPGFAQTGNLTAGNRLQSIDVVSVQSTEDRANSFLKK